MENIVDLVIKLVLIAQIVYESLVITYWVQQKEYRWDRFRSFVKSREGLFTLNVHFIAAKVASLFFLPFLISLIIVGFILLVYLDKIRTKGLTRPIFTLRAREVYLTLVSLAFLASAVGSIIFAQLSLLISPIIGVYWSGLLVRRTLRKEVLQAEAVFRNVKPKVVGVTGSYGKTTTKEFIATLLSRKYVVAKTRGGENTLFAIVRTIIHNLPGSTQVFVVEMGAYKRGEIKHITDIVRPTIAVVTGIEPQHLDLFGSIKNIQLTKYELIESLGKGGVAVLNYGNSYCRQIGQWAKESGVKVLSYCLGPRQRSLAVDLSARVLEMSGKGVKVEFDYKNKKKTLEFKFAGAHFVENAMAAILVAFVMGLDWKDVGKVSDELSTYEKTMKVYKTKSGATIIDDSHNSTPKAFEAALAYLDEFQGRKTVFTPGIIELGSVSDKVHTRLGKLLASKVDEVVLTRKGFESALKKGLGSSVKILKISDGNPNYLSELFKESATQKGIIILLEGKMPKAI